MNNSKILFADSSYYLFNTSEITAGFTTRYGGVSKEPFNFLNLGIHTGDDINNVIQNRKILSEKLNVNPEKIVFMNQTHSTNIEYISPENINRSDFGFYDIDSAFKNTDAVITNYKNIMLCAMTADCCPVLIFDSYNNSIAAIHSGWKGTIGKITEKTIYKMKTIFPSLKIDALKIFIGPCICGNCYEVDMKFIKIIESSYPEFKSYIVSKKSLFYFDIKKIIVDGIKNIGIPESNIFDSEICSYELSDNFYSYRKNNKTGRIVSFIKLKGDVE
ncbi:peptidoglycan editing factor PgeF [Candidatus Dependentiae bacterium]|nr:peptidoglycan editing factor PgeF [Candidatus Dependentiae bacterium]